MNESILQQFNCFVSCYFIAFFTVFLTLFMSSPSSHKKLESPLNYCEQIFVFTGGRQEAFKVIAQALHCLSRFD